MCMLDEIRAKRDEIYAIARKHKAEKLWVFGSAREERLAAQGRLRTRPVGKTIRSNEI